MTLSRLARLLCSSSALVLMPACQGKSTTAAKPAPAAAAPAEAKAASPAEAKPASPAEAKPASPADVKPAPPADVKPAPPAADATSLGQQFTDPKWFRKTMFGDKGKVLDTKRSEADDQGHFSSLIRFSLTDMTVDACADHLEGLVKDEVTNVKRETKPDGRVHLSGSTDRFQLTFICGEAKGETIAFVSYVWV